MSCKPLAASLLALILAFSGLAYAQQSGPYKVLKIQLVGGDGGFDYVTADSDGRNLYVARSGPGGHIGVFNLDTLAQVGDIPGTSAHGGAVDTATGHGFATSKPVTMFDAKTFAIHQEDRSPGQSRRLPERPLQSPLLHPQPFRAQHHGPRRQGWLDPRHHRHWRRARAGRHRRPRQNLCRHRRQGRHRRHRRRHDEDDRQLRRFKQRRRMRRPGARCEERHPLRRLPRQEQHDHPVRSRRPHHHRPAHRRGFDGAAFNPATMEAFSSQGDGTLTVVKENSPTSFAVEQTVPTPARAKTLTLDTKTNHILLITAEYGPVPALPLSHPQQLRPQERRKAPPRGCAARVLHDPRLVPDTCRWPIIQRPRHQHPSTRHKKRGYPANAE